MKYAIVEISGRQFWIETGKYYDFNRIPTELGKQITLNRVLLLNNEGNVLIGKPYLDSVTIKGKILEHLRGKKTIVYKMRPKKKTRKKQGHRQELTRVLIEDISIINLKKKRS
jgi:large subunit ribosomal protein L21